MTVFSLLAKKQMGGLKKGHQEMNLHKDNSRPLSITKETMKIIFSSHISGDNNFKPEVDSCQEAFSNLCIRDIHIQVIAWVGVQLANTTTRTSIIGKTIRTIKEAILNNGSQIITRDLSDQTTSEGSLDLKALLTKDSNPKGKTGKIGSH